MYVSEMEKGGFCQIVIIDMKLRSEASIKRHVTSKFKSSELI